MSNKDMQLYLERGYRRKGKSGNGGGAGVVLQSGKIGDNGRGGVFYGDAGVLSRARVQCRLGSKRKVAAGEKGITAEDEANGRGRESRDWSQRIGTKVKELCKRRRKKRIELKFYWGWAGRG